MGFENFYWVWKLLFIRGCIFCLFISTVFWFWLLFLNLLNSCGIVGYKLYVGSLGGACRWTGSNGSDKRACRSSKVYELSWKEIRVDVWGFWVVVGIAGFFWDDAVEDWFCDCWLAIFESVRLIFSSGRIYVYCSILRWKELKGLLLRRMWLLPFLHICTLSVLGMIKIWWKLQTVKKYLFY